MLIVFIRSTLFCLISHSCEGCDRYVGNITNYLRSPLFFPAMHTKRMSREIDIVNVCFL